MCPSVCYMASSRSFIKSNAAHSRLLTMAIGHCSICGLPGVNRLTHPAHHGRRQPTKRCQHEDGEDDELGAERIMLWKRQEYDLAQQRDAEMRRREYEIQRNEALVWQRQHELEVAKADLDRERRKQEARNDADAKADAAERQQQWQQQKKDFKVLTDQLKEHVRSLEVKIKSFGVPVPASSALGRQQPESQLTAMIVPGTGTAARSRPDMLAPGTLYAAEASEHLQTIAQLQTRLQQLQVEVERLNVENTILRPQHQPNVAGLQVYKLAELEHATNNFAKELGEGMYAKVYEGRLRHTSVAVKVFLQHGQDGFAQARRETEMLAGVHHPNITQAMGTCAERPILVFELMEAGSILDALHASPPATWKQRLGIALGMCQGLVYLHHHDPHIIHCDIKPANIFLTKNYNAKLGDLGVALRVPQDLGTKSFVPGSKAAGTMAYMDPAFFTTGKLVPASDLVGMGLTWLQMVTGITDPIGLHERVEGALEAGQLMTVVDPQAAEWPLESVTAIAELALACMASRPRDRPDLAAVVQPQLERLVEEARAAEQPAADPAAVETEHSTPAPAAEAPDYLLCPITRELMVDAVTASDGWTYERAAIMSWLSRGNSTSPMTRDPIWATGLVRNLAIISAVQEWKALHPDAADAVSSPHMA